MVMSKSLRYVCLTVCMSVIFICRDIALVIIQSKWWKEALRNTSKSPLGIDTTPLRKLIKKMPGGLGLGLHK